MKIRFTKHTIEKLTAFANANGKIRITESDIVQTVTEPDIVDIRSREPQCVAQRHIDAEHVLRVIYTVNTEENEIKVITFYPGRKSKYEK